MIVFSISDFGCANHIEMNIYLAPVVDYVQEYYQHLAQHAKYTNTEFEWPVEAEYSSSGCTPYLMDDQEYQ